MAVIGEADAGNDHKVDHVDRDRLAADGFTNAGAGAGHVGLQAGDFDGEHPPLVPAYLGHDNGLSGLPTFQSDLSCVQFLRRTEVKHDNPGGGEFRAGCQECGSRQAFGLTLGIRHGRQLFLKVAADIAFVIGRVGHANPLAFTSGYFVSAVPSWGLSSEFLCSVRCIRCLISAS